MRDRVRGAAGDDVAADGRGCFVGRRRRFAARRARRRRDARGLLDHARPRRGPFAARRQHRPWGCVPLPRRR